MVVQARVNVFWAIASASQDLEERIVVKVYAQFCAASVVSTSMVNATATRAGRERNAACVMMSVKCLTVMGMDIATMESVHVSMDSKANFVTKWTVLIQTALAMAIAHQRVLAFVNVVGRVQIVRLLIVMLCNVFLTALDMVHLIWKLKHVHVNVCGRVMTVPKNSVIRIVDLMVIAWVTPAFVTLGGQENIVC